MDDRAAQLFIEAVRDAIDAALDSGATEAEIKAELAYQIENYDWSAS